MGHLAGRRRSNHPAHAIAHRPIATHFSPPDAPRSRHDEQEMPRCKYVLCGRGVALYSLCLQLVGWVLDPRVPSRSIPDA